MNLVKELDEEERLLRKWKFLNEEFPKILYQERLDAWVNRSRGIIVNADILYVNFQTGAWSKSPGEEQ